MRGLAAPETSDNSNSKPCIALHRISSATSSRSHSQKVSFIKPDLFDQVSRPGHPVKRQPSSGPNMRSASARFLAYQGPGKDDD
ncbi:hypothetical protein LMH87_005100 [Akanthomyces muscarius]|uniref:Uncharacterized protein n=1 Tax=Akanthomyces muscarius TaxID=2231603 RepID=A0A9W8QK18_AKAMU|nr:hypothetical protein LMH87_005100 [Akanthomyces muscarius]KAJ4163366.1 hypothetical protein LMH87_005100 [Akanthomyces muscarius]